MGEREHATTLVGEASALSGAGKHLESCTRGHKQAHLSCSRGSWTGGWSSAVSMRTSFWLSCAAARPSAAGDEGGAQQAGVTALAGRLDACLPRRATCMHTCGAAARAEIAAPPPPTCAALIRSPSPPLSPSAAVRMPCLAHETPLALALSRELSCAAAFLGFASAAWSNTPSKVPYWRSSAAAVLGPMPCTPGTLSAVARGLEWGARGLGVRWDQAASGVRSGPSRAGGSQGCACSTIMHAVHKARHARPVDAWLLPLQRTRGGACQ